MFAIIKSESKPLTIETAIHHRDLPPSPTERTLNPARVKYLTDQVAGGLAVPFNWAAATLGDKTYRMNGQHSSKALADLNGTMPAGLIVHYDEYKVETKEDLARLFCQFDSRKSSRTPVDIAGAFQGINDEMADVDKGVAKLGIEGFVWWSKHVEGTPVPAGDDVYTLFSKTNLHPYLHFMGEVYSIKTPELRRPAIAAAIYTTHCLSTADARQFWFDVARGGTIQDDAPSTMLDNWLKAIKEDPDSVKDLKPGNLYQACIYAWNAMRDHKTLSSIRHDARKGLLKAI